MPWLWLPVVPQQQLYVKVALYDGMLPILQDLISIFNDSELELLVCGLPEIDTDDLRANTEYTGYTPSSAVVQYFWEVSHCPCSAHYPHQPFWGLSVRFPHGLLCLAGLQCYTCAVRQSGQQVLLMLWAPTMTMALWLPQLCTLLADSLISA